MDAGAPLIGGLPLVTLTSAAAAGICEAVVAPGRGMMLMSAHGRLQDGSRVELLETVSLDEAARRLDGGPEDFAGNAAFSFGGAILLPFANRIRGADVPGRRAIVTRLGSASAELPRNWGGKAPGAAQYAMHGLILALPVADYVQTSAEHLRGVVPGWNFGGRWPSHADLGFDWRLTGGVLELVVEVTNVGAVDLPLGIGWHPYFKVRSGRREQVRLSLPAHSRTVVENYDTVLPTGDVIPVRDSPYDFTTGDGKPLGSLYLDDTFTDLEPAPGTPLTLRVIDPAAASELRLTSPSPDVRAVQIYAPPDRAVVVVEPQYNLADPFWSGWPPGRDTGMVRLAPGETSVYAVRTEFIPYPN